jgi:hypothetical protein
MKPPSIWDDPLIDADLRVRWAMSSDIMPCRRIADELTARWGHVFTANAVIGRANRLRLGFRHGRHLNLTPRQPRPPRQPLQPKPPPPPPRLGGRCECSYPFGYPREPGFRYCGAPSLPGKSYCAEHHARTHAPVRAAVPAEAAA